MSHTLDNTIILGQAFPEVSLLNKAGLRNALKYPEISYIIFTLLELPLFLLSTRIHKYPESTPALTTPLLNHSDLLAHEHERGRRRAIWHLVKEKRE